VNKTALILIDIQNDYFPGGILELKGADAAATKAAAMLAHCRQEQQPIIHIQHESVDPKQALFTANTHGQKIHSSVVPNADELCITKHYPNSFWKTELESVLHKQAITHLFIVGMMTHMCVSATTRAAMERGFKVTVINDACATCALQLDNVDIPADVVHRTALAELTLLADVKKIETVLSMNTKVV